MGPGGLQRLTSSSAVLPSAVFSSAPDVSLSCQLLLLSFPVSVQYLTPLHFCVLWLSVCYLRLKQHTVQLFWVEIAKRTEF